MKVRQTLASVEMPLTVKLFGRAALVFNKFLALIKNSRSRILCSG
jgi:hypothetical protein